MKSEYSLRVKSLTERQALINSLLNENYIVSSYKHGSEYVIEIYGHKQPSLADTPVGADILAKIKKKIGGTDNDTTINPNKPFSQPYTMPKKDPFDKHFDPFGPTIFFYGSSSDLLSALKDDLDGDTIK